MAEEPTSRRAPGLVEAYMSMTCPNWSTARYRYTHRPVTLTYILLVHTPAVSDPIPAKPAASTSSGATRRPHRWMVT